MKRKNPVFIPGTPNLLTDSERARLHCEWQKLTATTLGTNIHDPLLHCALEQIRDGYYQIFSEKRYLYAKQRMFGDSPELLLRLKDLDIDLIAYNNHSFRRLTYPGYGVSAEQQYNLFNGQHRGENIGNPLTMSESKKLIGQVIGGAIESFDQAINPRYYGKKVQRMTVPGHASVMARPDTLGLERSVPRTDWVAQIADTPSGDTPHR